MNNIYVNPLVAQLNRLEPDVCIEIFATVSPDQRWDGDDGNTSASLHRQGLQAFDSEVRVSVVVNGKMEYASSHLGGSWYRSARQLLREDISGYLPQMIEEAVIGLYAKLPPDHHQGKKLGVLGGFLCDEMKRRYAAQRAEIKI